MIKHTIPLLLIAISCLTSYCQVEEKKYKVNLPGEFVIDFGFSTPLNTPAQFQTSFLGSRTFNILYYHEFVLPIAKSRFSLLPGLGFGLDRFKFSNSYTLIYEGNNLTMSKAGLDIRKSQLITDYFDIPLELRFTNNPSDPSRSFKAAVGFKFGTLISSYTKMTYYDDAIKIRDKSRRDWNLNKFRYGLYGKIGVGNFSIYSHLNLNTLFQKNNGPDDSSINVLTTGISVSGF